MTKYIVLVSLLIVGCSDNFNPDENSGLPQDVQTQALKVQFHQRGPTSIGATLSTPKWLGKDGLCKIDYTDDIRTNMLNTQTCISSISAFRIVSVEFNLGEKSPEDFGILAVETVNRNGEGINKVPLFSYNKDSCNSNICVIDFEDINYMSNINRLKEIYSEGLEEYYMEGDYNPKYTPVTFVLDSYNPSVRDTVFTFNVEVEYN